MLHDALLMRSEQMRTSAPDPMIRLVPGQKILNEMKSMSWDRREEIIEPINMTHAIVSVSVSERTTFQGTG